MDDEKKLIELLLDYEVFFEVLNVICWFGDDLLMEDDEFDKLRIMVDRELMEVSFDVLLLILFGDFEDVVDLKEVVDIFDGNVLWNCNLEEDSFGDCNF